jgi:ABC-2 type transport system permease protein
MKILSRITVYSQVWWLTAANALQVAFVNRWSNVLFLFGKTLRVSMSLLFFYLLKNQGVTVAGYTTDQVIVFFLTYQLIDIIAQMLFRGVYTFGQLIRTGEFDFLMAKPMSPLFRALTGRPDVDDAIFLIPTLAVSWWVLAQLNVTITVTSAVWYVLLLMNSLLIVAGLHIIVLALGVLTMEVDNLIWTYRDLSRLGQFPVTMYLEPMRTALFFILPIGFMVTIPAQILMGLPPTYSVLITTIMGVTFFWGSLWFWNWALRKYSSASS